MYINYLAVIVGAIISMMLGSLWYGPFFGKVWMRLSGMSDEKIAGAKVRGMVRLYALAFVGSLIMSYVLAYSLSLGESYFKAGGISSGLMAGFWNWFGFIAPVTLGNVLWEGKSWKLWILNNAYYLLSLILMGMLLGAWR